MVARSEGLMIRFQFKNVILMGEMESKLGKS